MCCLKRCRKREFQISIGAKNYDQFSFWTIKFAPEKFWRIIYRKIVCPISLYSNITFSRNFLELQKVEIPSNRNVLDLKKDIFITFWIKLIENDGITINNFKKFKLLFFWKSIQNWTEIILRVPGKESLKKHIG